MFKSWKMIGARYVAAVEKTGNTNEISVASPEEKRPRKK
jgi:hypothetical protein